MMSKSLDEQYLRILKKCASYPEFTDSCLSEGSIRHLIVEKLDKKDIDSVSKSIEKTRTALDKLKSYADELQLQTELQEMYEYVDALIGALDKAASQLTNVSFKPGVVSSFFGKKVYLPQIASAAIELNTKAVDFGRGFNASMKKIKSQLVPILKDADEDQTLSDAIGSNPDIDLGDISKGLEDELVKSLGGTLFQKVKGFFGKRKIGKTVEILESPGLDIDMKALAKTISDALVSAKIKNLLGKAPPEAPPESLVTDLADEMEDTADQAEENAENQEDKKDEPEGEGEAGAEGEGESEEKGEDTPEGYALGRNDLKAIKAAMDTAKSKKKSQTKALGASLNSILGKEVFAENKMYDLQKILCERAVLVESAVSRWQKIAGIIK